MDADDLVRITRMCGFCGFCEHVCPTYSIVRRRHYSPRGRVAAVERVARGGSTTKAVLESLYTCLLCHACLYECPTGIDVAELVRDARALLRGGGAEQHDAGKAVAQALK